MEQSEETLSKKNGFITKTTLNDNLTVLDLSNKNIHNFDDSIQLPVNLAELNLSHNYLEEVPATIQNLTKLRTLDLSYNKIKYYDEAPQFYQTIEQLDISHNKLLGPPYWIWANELKSLKEVNISNNWNITCSLVNGYFEELLKYRTLVTHIIIYNCNLKSHLKLLNTFPKAKLVNLGTPRLSYTEFANCVQEIPCTGLDECYDIESLNLINTGLTNIKSNILMYKNLKQIDFSLNALSYIPPEFSFLENLEVCILSFNNLLYLPDNFTKLQKLTSLCLNNNILCMLPEKICELPFLKKLDLYDNHLYDLPEGIENLLEVDIAQNYFEEPIDIEYVKKKERIRLKSPERCNGRKVEVEKAISEYSNQSDEEFRSHSNSEEQDIEIKSSCSSEDWDSDEYWVPNFFHHTTTSKSPWLLYIKRKIEEGNFCPVDAHQVSVSEQVEYEKLCYPKVVYESDGQFDDYSSDESS